MYVLHIFSCTSVTSTLLPLYHVVIAVLAHGNLEHPHTFCFFFFCISSCMSRLACLHPPATTYTACACSPTTKVGYPLASFAIPSCGMQEEEFQEAIVQAQGLVPLIYLASRTNRLGTKMVNQAKEHATRALANLAMADDAVDEIDQNGGLEPVMMLAQHQDLLLVVQASGSCLAGWSTARACLGACYQGTACKIKACYDRREDTALAS